MSLSIILSILALAAATAVGLWAVDSNRRRVRLLRRATVGADGQKAVPLIVVGPQRGRAERAAAHIEPLLPSALRDPGSVRQLGRAGFESPAAVVVYTLIRILTVAAVAALAVTLLPRESQLQYTLLLIAAVLIGLALPPMVLARMVHHRQDRLRRAIPDALDLLLVCVEAGVSLDTALLRVGRELARVHPELAEELLDVNRTTNAGMRREEALHRMYERTGVRELRALAGTLVQSERWGTSIGNVLRVYAESMRLKRRQAAEKRAAVVASKMVFPLALLILPALFIVLAGPVFLGLEPIFETLTGR
jgi:tight adherence protein C